MLETVRAFFSPETYPIGITLAVIVLAFVLVSNMRGVVTLLLQRLAPDWIARVTLLLQAAVLVGELALIVSFIASGWLAAWLAILLLLALLAAMALSPGNPLSDRAMLWRKRGLAAYRAGNWEARPREQARRVVARVGKQGAQVIDLQRLRTLPQTLQSQVQLRKSRAKDTSGDASTAQQRLSSTPIALASVSAVDADAGRDGQRREAPRWIAAHYASIEPLRKRPTLGKKSVKALYR